MTTKTVFVVGNGRVLGAAFAGVTVRRLTKAQYRAAKAMLGLRLEVEEMADLYETLLVNRDVEAEHRRDLHRQQEENTARRVAANGSVVGVHRTYTDMIIDKLSK